MHCINCGKELDENSEFCKFCSTKFENRGKKTIFLITALIIVLFVMIIFILCASKLHIAATTINSNNNLVEKSIMQYPLFTGSRVLVEVKSKKLFQKIDKSTMITIQYRIEQNLIKNGYYDSIVEQVASNKFLLYLRNEFDKKEIEKVLNIESSILQFKYVLGDYGNGQEVQYQNANLSGEDIEKASLEYLNGDYIINIKFNQNGAKKFVDLTKELTGKYLAIFLNDNLVSTPKITEPITGGEAQISVYSFTYDELKEIVAALNTEVIKTELKILDIK